MSLSADQQKVADLFMKFIITPNQPEMVIEGFPGSGKSYLTKYLIDALRHRAQLTNLISPGQSEMSIHCTATTNKAAAVLADLSGQSTKTIHKLLGLKVSNNFKTGATSIRQIDRSNTVTDSLIIIDEASYANAQLLKFIRSSTDNCKILYIGDRYQLASVGEQECPVFTEITNKGVLQGSQRFSNTGPIASLAAEYRACIDGASFPSIQPDGKVIRHCTGTEFQAAITAEFSSPTLDSDHAKVLAWSNKKVHDYNNYIRGLHTKDLSFQRKEKVITNQPIPYRKDGRDRLLSTESMAIVSTVRSGVEHGIPGWWIMLEDPNIPVFQPENPLAVKAYLKVLADVAKQSRDWQAYFTAKEFFADLRPIHAATVYKAQGSTYKKVFIDLADIGRCTHTLTTARMLHVAITRASDEVYLYGQLPKRYNSII